MRNRAMSRRTMLRQGGCALLVTAALQPARASAETGRPPTSRDVIRKYYAAWETKDWHPVDILLADDFTFSSPLDDHIGKSDFKTGCWDTQVAYIERFDLKQVIGADDEAFVRYIGHTTNGKTFQNVEYFQLREGKVRAVECYFGGKSSFPSAASNAKG